MATAHIARRVSTKSLPLHDPKGNTDHTGLCDEVAAGCFDTNPAWWSQMLQDVTQWLLSRMEDKKEMVLHFWCRSGRHRSVVVAMIVGGAIAQLPGFKVRYVHMAEWWWTLTRCQREARRGRAPRYTECRMEPGPRRQEISGIVAESMRDIVAKLIP